MEKLNLNSAAQWQSTLQIFLLGFWRNYDVCSLLYNIM